MAEITLKEKLNKYIPKDEYVGILTSGVITKTRLDKENRILEMYADFPYIVKLVKNKIDWNFAFPIWLRISIARKLDEQKREKQRR